MIRPFSGVPQVAAEVNLALSACGANTTTELSFTGTSYPALNFLKPEMTILVTQRDPITLGGVAATALVTGLGIVGAYVDSTQTTPTLKIRFSNSTAGALGAASTSTFKILAL